MDTSLTAYLIAITLLTLTPGVDTVLVIRNTARGGFRDGALTSLGICTGLWVHASISAVGVSIILLQSAWAFRGLKLAGAVYLVWLGAVSLRSAVRGGAPMAVPEKGTVSGRDARRSLLEGFLSNLLNPKAVVFYMAFLPQFIDPARSAFGQSLFLAGLHFGIAMGWQCVLAAMVDHARTLIARRGIRRVLDSVTGSILTAFGIQLALSR